jgi:ribosome-associated protein
LTSPVITRPVPDAGERAGIAARAAADKQGSDIVVLDVGEIIAITEAFVIVSANNTRQVRTIVDEVELAIKVLGGDEDEGPRSVEGLQDASWVLMDYGDIIVHVFLAETRSYYDLERLWADAPRLDWETESTGSEVQAR